MSYAKGKYAFGFCDRTGFRYPLKDLVPEIVKGKRTGSLIGRDMVDKDHPQNFLGDERVHDSQGLRDPRPDNSVDSMFGWDPVGNPAQYIRGQTGKVTVTTS